MTCKGGAALLREPWAEINRCNVAEKDERIDPLIRDRWKKRCLSPASGRRS